AAGTRRPACRRRAAASSSAAYRERVFSTRGVRRFGVEQPVQVHNEIAHVGVVDRLLRLGLPGGISGRVVREYPDDVHLVEVLEGDVLEIDEFTAKHKVEQLLRGAVWHACWFLEGVPGRDLREILREVTTTGDCENAPQFSHDVRAPQPPVPRV